MPLPRPDASDGDIVRPPFRREHGATEAVSERLAREWDELADRIGAVPFLRPGWMQAWVDAFGGRLRVAVVRERGELAGVWPVLQRFGALTSPTNWHTPVFGPVVARPDIAAALLEQLVDGGVTRIELDFADPADPAADALRASGLVIHERIRTRSPWLALDGDPLGRLSAKRRRAIRSRRRRLRESLGAISLEVHAGAQGTGPAFAEALRIEASGWKGDGGTAIATDLPSRAFYESVALWAADRGELRVLLLRCGGQAVACDIAIESGGAHYLLKTGYDDRYRDGAPGVVLRCEAIEHAARIGLDSYEFLGAPAPTKLEWTDSCRDRILVQAFAVTRAGRLDRIARVHGRALVTQLRLRDVRRA